MFFPDFEDVLDILGKVAQTRMILGFPHHYTLLMLENPTRPVP